jgi:hypothetical protein
MRTNLTAGILTVAMLALLASCGGSAAPTTPSVAPTPTTMPVASECGAGALSSIQVNTVAQSATYSTVASVFLVGPDAKYCAAIGFTDGRAFCTIQMQGAPENTSCVLYFVGTAKDTGVPGPTWSLARADGTSTYCTGVVSGCEHTADPFQINAYASGVYRVCPTDPASCVQLTVDRSR